MIQREIDLLPGAMRARSLAGLRAGQYAAAFIAAIGLVVVLSTHSRVMLSRAQQRLVSTEAQANIVLACEAQSAELKASLAEMQKFVGFYDKVAVPVEVTRLLATMVNELPPSMTLDRIDLAIQTGPVTAAPTARSKGQEKDAPPTPRELLGEVIGFAATDQDVVELASRLQRIEPFESVMVDYSRKRDVRTKAAREFRMSFRVPLDVSYEVADRGSGSTAPRPGKQLVTEQEEQAHVGD